jgi:hypothetical protein
VAVAVAVAVVAHWDLTAVLLYCTAVLTRSMFVSPFSVAGRDELRD